MSPVRSAVDWLFGSRVTSEITIAQFPNPPLWIFWGTVVARWLGPEDSGAFTAPRGEALVALGWWVVDEPGPRCRCSRCPTPSVWSTGGSESARWLPFDGPDIGERPQ